jgi:hypothetical protein
VFNTSSSPHETVQSAENFEHGNSAEVSGGDVFWSGAVIGVTWPFVLIPTFFCLSSFDFDYLFHSALGLTSLRSNIALNFFQAVL